MARVVGANVKDRGLVRDRRRQLVEAALVVFLRKGYHDATVRDIGRQAGFTQGTIYNYVRAKSDILYLVCDDVIRAYQDVAARAVDGLTDPASRLSSAVRAVVAAVHAHQDAILLLFQESHALDRRSLANILGRVSEYIEMFERLVADAVRDGRIRAIDTRLAANILTFLPTMLALRRWDLRGHVSRDGQLSGVAEFLLRGLRAAELGDGGPPPAAVRRAPATRGRAPGGPGAPGRRDRRPDGHRRPAGAPPGAQGARITGNRPQRARLRRRRAADAAAISREGG